MWFRETFYPGGRIGRLRYFIAHFVGMLVVMVPAAVFGVLGVLASAFSAGGPSAARTLFFGLAAAVLILGYLYIVVVLTTKRLHDLGWSGWHALWIYGISFMSGAAESQGAVLVQTFFSLCALGIGIWLLFARGQEGGNDYGYPID